MTSKGRGSIIWSFNYAIEGIVFALRTQRNMRIHVAIAFFTALGSLVLGVTRMQLVAVVFAIALVFITELLNTAVEAAVDLAMEGYDPLAKMAKDVAAAAVLVAAVNALFVAYLVLFDPVRDLLHDGLNVVRFASPDLTVITLALVVLAVLVFKALTPSQGTWFEGGWPSGHAALAFSAATIIGFVTYSGAAFALALFIAFLVVQSRVEAEIHTIPQSLLGAALGVVLTALVFQVFFR